MPTSRPRYMITESDDLDLALQSAAKLWPELAEERNSLVRKIIDLGIEDVKRRTDESLSRKREAIFKVAGSLSGVWPENWRNDLRDEWPE